MTQEKLGSLIGSFIGKPPDKDHDGDLYILMGLSPNSAGSKWELGSNEHGPACLDVVVKFRLSDTDNGNHQQLEIVAFAPMFPDKPYPLKLKEEQYPEAVRFCSELPAHIVPHVNTCLKNGFFYVKKGIEDPGYLPDEWLASHWLKPNFMAVTMAFTMIVKKFGTVA